MGMINLLIRNQDLLHHTGTELYQPVWFNQLRLVPATRPLKSLHEGTGRGDLSGYEQFTRSVLRNK